MHSLILAAALASAQNVSTSFETQNLSTDPLAFRLDPFIIVGSLEDAQDVTGSAQVIDSLELEKFKYTDIQKILRQVPGVSIQVEDGFGLRPNISIRGVVSERSSRITLLEDNVLIAPAPYSAPSAYYFPTAGRLSGIEVLKGPSAITQGPYTIGGALNMISTPIPEDQYGRLNLEYGQDNTWRVHGHYGQSQDNFGYLLETHNWQSDGFQDIDRSDRDTGLEKQDYMAKLRFNSTPGEGLYQQFDLKLQYAEEDSNQSYLGLTDNDFNSDTFRRYGLSDLDNIATEHQQIIANYLISLNDHTNLTITAYNNEHERNWFKTEGIDLDGSINAEDFDRVSWNSVIGAVNRGQSIGDFTSAQLQAILDGADTAEGAIQLRSNAREYYSRGIQLKLNWDMQIGNTQHDFEVGLRWHKDEEDRLQRNSTYTQTNGQLILSDLGRLGNAGNRIQQAEALALHIYDRIQIGNLTLTPGLRYEDIDQERVRYETRASMTDDTASRAASNIRDERQNSTDVLLPGIGLLYDLDNGFSLLAGAHKGFTAPTNAPGVREEEALNYEAGFRFKQGKLNAEVIGFYSDYDNLLGVCTNSSGSDCEIGDAFNGDAATIAGLEAYVTYAWDLENGWSVPAVFSYTYIDGEFDSDIADTDFFGDVSAGDPLPQIPENQAFAEIGLVNSDWAFHLSANYVDSTCVLASCGAFEQTESAVFFDISGRYQVNDLLAVYAKIENLNDEDAILGRLPYGARPYRGSTALVGVQLDF